MDAKDRRIQALEERCERLAAVAVAAETLVYLEWPLHKDGLVEMGTTHHIHQLQHWIDELQVGDLGPEQDNAS
jgi:hypothetical protein